MFLKEKLYQATNVTKAELIKSELYSPDIFKTSKENEAKKNEFVDAIILKCQKKLEKQIMSVGSDFGKISKGLAEKTLEGLGDYLKSLSPKEYSFEKVEQIVLKAIEDRYVFSAACEILRNQGLGFLNNKNKFNILLDEVYETKTNSNQEELESLKENSGKKLKRFELTKKSNKEMGLALIENTRICQEKIRALNEVIKEKQDFIDGQNNIIHQIKTLSDDYKEALSKFEKIENEKNELEAKIQSLKLFIADYKKGYLDGTHELDWSNSQKAMYREIYKSNKYLIQRLQKTLDNDNKEYELAFEKLSEYNLKFQNIRNEIHNAEREKETYVKMKNNYQTCIDINKYYIKNIEKSWAKELKNKKEELSM